jgi:hypothetical protein
MVDRLLEWSIQKSLKLADSFGVQASVMSVSAPAFVVADAGHDEIQAWMVT